MTTENNKDLVSKLEAQEMIDKALRRHNRRSTIISSILGWILIGGYSFGLFHVVQNTQNLDFLSLNVRFINMYFIMRPELDNSLRVIKKYFYVRTSISFPYKNDIKKEFEEWINESFKGGEIIWTLPDLTKMERFENFCRSIRKRIN